MVIQKCMKEVPNTFAAVSTVLRWAMHVWSAIPQCAVVAVYLCNPIKLHVDLDCLHVLFATVAHFAV